MQHPNKNNSSKQKRLVLDKEKRSLYRPEKYLQNKIPQQRLKSMKKINNIDLLSNLRINCLNAPKTEQNGYKPAENQPKQEQVLKFLNQNTKAFQKQNQGRKKSFHYRRSVSQNHNQPIKVNPQSSQQQQEKQLSGFINIIFTLLTEGFIFQVKSGFINVKKEKLIALFHYLLSLTCGDYQNNQYANSLAPLKNVVKRMYKYLEKVRKVKKSLKLKIVSNVSKVKHNPIDMTSKLESMTSKMQEALKEKTKIDSEVSQLKTYLLQLNQELKSNQQELRQCHDKIKHFKQQEAFLSNKVVEIQKEVQEKQKFFKSNNQKAQDLINFVEKQQEKKILHWVSQAYKKIELQIYEYASFLQINPMASSLTWQPKPFRIIQEWIDQEMQRVIIFVMSKAEDPEEKSKKMKEFINSSLKKYKSKDQQMTKITDFKTTSIRKFVAMMQKWMQNWQLKQEYLVSLRKEFIIQSENIDQIIQELFQNQKNSGKDQSRINLLQKLKLNWEKAALNYKYGNSFY